MRRAQWFVFLSAVILLIPFVLVFGNSQSVPPAKTGAPGEGLCTECHIGTANSRGGGVSVQFTTATYTAGIPQLLTLRVNPGGGGPSIGFQITARLENGQQPGRFATYAFSNASVQTVNNTPYLSHSRASTETTYYFQWIPAETATGNLRFYVAAVAGVPDGAATSADAVYTASYTLSPDSRPRPDGYRWDSPDISGGAATQFVSLSNDGRLLGRYQQSGTTKTFVRSANGVITTVNGSPVRINSSGTMIEGNRVILSDGSTRTVSIAGAQSVTLLDINDLGFLFGQADAAYFIQSPSGGIHTIDGSYIPAVVGGLTNGGSFYGTRTMNIPQGILSTVDGYSRVLSSCSYVYTNSFSMPGVNDYGDDVSNCNATVLHTPQVTASLEMINRGGFRFGHLTGFSPPEGLATVNGLNNSLQAIGVDGYGSQRPVLLTPCSAAPSVPAVTVSGDGGTFQVPMSGADGCRPSIYFPPWVTLVRPDIAGGTLQFSAGANISQTPRVDIMTFNQGSVSVTQTPSSCPNIPNPTYVTVPAAGGQVTVNVATGAGCQWTAVPNASWATVTTPPVTGSGSFTLNFAPNTTAADGRSVTVAIGINSFSASQDGNRIATNNGLRFVPVTPCRVLDTRAEGGKTGAYGPPRMRIQTSRDIPVPQSGCGIPGAAQAYALNVTVVPPGYLGFVTLWPSGQSMPLASTLNSWDGRVTANAAIIGAGANGSVSVYVSNDSDVVMDINGYFVSAQTQPEALAFYPVTPCRVADTRTGEGKTGAFGPPFLGIQTSRTFPVPSSSCGIPAAARAYSLNVTAVPKGYLGFVTIYPSTQARPLASTLNSWDGSIAANAAIVPAGADGGVSVYASNDTDIVLDVNGYFAPATNPGSNNYYPQTPCRLVDTRTDGGLGGAFGPPLLAANTEREFVFTYTSGSCYVTTMATAAVFNVTVAPPGPLAYLSIWPSGMPRPLVSTLNAFSGQVTANAAIVPIGVNRAIRVYVFNNSNLVMDYNGYFSPY